MAHQLAGESPALRMDPRLKALLFWLLLGAVLILGIRVSHRAMAGEAVISPYLLTFLTIGLTLFLQINIHELGHLVMGRILGYRLLLYQVGPIAWEYKNDNMQLSLRKNRGYAGACAMLPPTDDLPITKQIWYFAGGLLFNVLSLFPLSIVLLTTSSGVVYGISFLAIVVTLMLLLLNALPGLSDIQPTDGRIISAVLRGSPLGKQLLECVNISAALVAGVRPRDLDLEEFDWNTLQNLDSLVPIQLGVMHYFRCLDAGDSGAALTFIETITKHLDVCPYHLEVPIRYELIYCYSVLRPDETEARGQFNRVADILSGDRDINGRRVLAAYKIFTMGDLDEGLTHCREGLEAFEIFPLRGQAIMERSLIEGMIEQSDSIRDP